MSLQFLKNALLNPNVKAFMLTIRKSEGTDASDGYSYLFGSSPRNTRRFPVGKDGKPDFSHHPHINEPFNIGDKADFSSAAGAYQILFGTWEAIRKKYSLPDFSPASQDIACVELISQQNVLQHLMNGDFDIALRACSHIWASLPFAPYGQPIHSVDVVTNWYKNAGGVIS